jgi:hypothetical protein
MPKLRANGRRLYLGGEALRGHIGFNSFYPFERAFTSGTTTWREAIEHAAAVGAKVLRVPIAPRYKTNLERYVWRYAAPHYTLRQPYIDLVINMLDYASSRRVSLLVVPFWRAADPADVVGAPVSSVADPASAACDYLRQISAQMVSAFGAHDALAGWCISGELDVYGWGAGVLPETNVALGTPASYAAPQDVLWHSAASVYLRTVANVIKAADPAAFCMGGHGRGVARASGAHYFARAFPHRCLPDVLDAVGVHPYLGADGTDYTVESVAALAEECVERWGADRPLIVTEFGARISGDAVAAHNDPAGAKVLGMYDALRSAGVPLMLEWQLCPAADDNAWGIWPGETRGRQRLDAVAMHNRTPAAAAYVSPRYRATRPPFAACAYLSGAADSIITVPHAAGIKPAAFTLAAWVKCARPSSTLSQRVLACATTSPPRGFALVQAPSAGTSYGEVYGQLVTDNGGSAADVKTLGGVLVGDDGWHHYALTWDGTALRVYTDGMSIGGQLTLPAGHTWAHSTSDLVIGSDGSSAHFAGRISDVQMYDRALRHADVQRVMDGEQLTGCVARWKLEADARDSARWNAGTLGAGVTFGPAVDERDAVEREV